jgi:4-hydroxy-tetrahydrodipicolinate synthase
MSESKLERKIEGIYTALATPFAAGGEIDYAALSKLLDRQIGSGVMGFVVSGTTGESPTLNLREKEKLFSFVKNHCAGKAAGRIDLIAGTGTNDTRESIELTALAESLGYKRTLVVVPYYNKPSQSGLIQHYSAIADSTRSEVILYNVPGRTGISLSVDAIVELSAHERITGIKEASGNIEFLKQILSALKDKGRALATLSGDDATYLPFLEAGGNGVISVASHVCPTAMLEIEKAVSTHDSKKANTVQSSFLPLFENLFIEANPTPLKWMLQRLGIGDGSLRLPLTKISKGSEDQLNAILSSYRIDRGEFIR